jgi:hypothetical protein
MSMSIGLDDLEPSGAAGFPTIGTKHIGRIIAIKQTQQSDLKTGQPKFFPSGDPMMIWLITIQPDEGGDPVTLWAKGGKQKAATGSGDSMLAAIAKGVKAVGAKSVEVGGRLGVAYTGDSEASPGWNPAKCYTAQYAAPVAEPTSVDVDLFTQ